MTKKSKQILNSIENGRGNYYHCDFETHFLQSITMVDAFQVSYLFAIHFILISFAKILPF